MLTTSSCRTDWDVMILHYLGLDHIGHLEGPRSHLIEPKLKDMGQVIEKVWSGLRNKKKDDLDSMMIVVGDHGMADGGGHGGSSTAEINVPCVIIGDQAISSDQDNCR